MSEIDPATFKALQETAGADFVRELVGTFLEEAPGMLAELRSAAEARDAVTFRRTAHSLKSNSNTFGALALGAVARNLELDGLASDPMQNARALDELDAAYALAAHALEGLRRG